jgi:hypothetical protein
MQGLTANLAHARFGDVEDSADLAQIEFFVIIEREYQTLAFRQVSQRLGQGSRELLTLQLFGRRGAPTRQQAVAVGLIAEQILQPLIWQLALSCNMP